ncbi:MAG TPA: serine/threonine-protein kinase [Rubricoccaceae bacterium]|nr:serine/threonine-protein kinase [Rubricoccaceae bacterium]
MLARFRRERQVLAALDHPGIARLLDGGAAEDGRPYLVMELVEGAPITAYADGRRLGLDGRLGLFAQACEGVAYAHRRLVVHRDLKPSNVLVGEGEGGRPVVKLLDFGIARLLDAGDGEAVTRLGRPMTPEYAAPEQRAGAAVTTATDVYALGVLLYELLTGRRPEAAPRPPSAVAAERRYRGDLDTLALTALHPDPDRRYGSAEALLDDLRRLRAGLPLRARPDTPGYRLRRFVGRHRWGVGAATLGVALLVAFTVALALQQRQTARARDDAEATVAFLERLFVAADPFGEEPMDSLHVRGLLDEGVARIRDEFATQPLVQARLLHTIGRTYHRIGLPARAEPLLREAVARRAAAPPHDRAASLTALAAARREQGAHAEAETLAREALGLLGADAPTDLRAEAEVELGLTLTALGRHAEAGPLLHAAYDRLRAAYGADDARALGAAAELAGLLLGTGRLDEAEARYRDVLARLRRRDGGPHLRHAVALDPLAFLLMLTGRSDEAVSFSTESVALTRAGAPGSARLRQVLVNHAGILRRLGRLDEAEAALDEALALPMRRPQDQALALGALASVHADRGDVDAAVAAQRDALAILRADLGDAEPVTAQSAVKLAVLLQRQGAWAEAERLLLDAHAMLSRTAGEHGGGSEEAARALAALYEAWGRPAPVGR